MKRTKKRIVWIIVSLILIFSVHGGGLQEVKAATLNDMRAAYPDKSYWNSNYMNKAWQCHGFACTLGYSLTGSDPYTWQKVYDLNSLKPGDIVRCNRPHTIMVTAVNGDTIQYVDCNWYAANTVKWDQTISRNAITQKFGSLAYVMCSPTSVSSGTTAGTETDYTKPVISDVKINSIDASHVSLSLTARNAGLVRIVTTSKTTGEKQTKDFTSGFENIQYTFQKSSMTNPGNRFSIFVYAYRTAGGGDEQLHRVRYGDEADTVTLPEDEKSMHYTVEDVPTTVTAGKYKIGGWVINPSAVTKVTAVVNDAVEYECKRETRPDVGAAFPGYDASKAGFVTYLCAADFLGGTNTLTIRAYTSATDYIEIARQNVDVIKLDSGYFDWSWYYFTGKSIPEIAAIGKNPEKLLHYYYEYGIEKGHMPCIGFSPSWYLQKNTDVAQQGKYADAYVHFVKYALPNNELRETSQYLNLKYYKENNKDLSAMNAGALFNHFCLYGKYENRPANTTNLSKALHKLFSVREYAEQNTDIKQQLGDGKTTESADAIWSQFFAYSLPGNENRRSSNTFDMDYYKKTYGIGTSEAAFWNYMETGYEKGYLTQKPAPTDMEKVTVTITGAVSPYTGNAQTPSVKVTCQGKELVQGTDYTLEYQDNTNAGTATIIVSGCGDYTGSVRKYFEITKADQELYISVSATELKEGEQGQITAKAAGGIYFTSSSPQIVTVDETGKMTAAGTGTAVITVRAEATDNYYAAEKEIMINVTEAEDKEDQGDTGKDDTTKDDTTEDDTTKDDTVKDDTGKDDTTKDDTTKDDTTKDDTTKDDTTKDDTTKDDTVKDDTTKDDTTKDNIKKDDTAKDDTVQADTEEQTEDLIETVYVDEAATTYTGKSKKPAVIVTDTNGHTVPSSGYTITYTDNKNVGQATVTVTGTGNYTGTVSATFTILPKGTNLSRITAKKRGFAVKWKKQTAQTTGYQLQYSTNVKFKGAKALTVKKNTTVSATAKKLKAKQKYYVRVRTYKTVKINGKSTRLYSGWSKIKAIRVK